MSEAKAAYRTKPQQAEADFQESVLTWLKLAVPQALVFQFAKPRSRPRCPGCGRVVGALAGGVPVGWFDLLLIVGGTLPPRYYHIELKADHGVVTGEQRQLQNDLLNIGASAMICYSVREVASYLRLQGIKLRLEAPG